MPSPFSGMDPHLGSPDIFPDLHHMLAAELRIELNRVLPAPYYARVEMRPELGIVAGEDEDPRRIIPDVLLLRHPKLPVAPDGVAVLEPQRRAVSPGVILDIPDESIRHYFVEIRDSEAGHKLITLIEILGPSNKRTGPDRDSYAAKQRQILESDASLVEIDLLRSGRRVLPNPAREATVDRLVPRPGYVAFVSRSWVRENLGMGYQAFPVGLREPLPCIPIPLTQGEAEISLDLQSIFDRLYDESPYRMGSVDYARPPVPPLAPEDAAWAAGLLADLGRPAPEAP